MIDLRVIVVRKYFSFGDGQSLRIQQDLSLVLKTGNTHHINAEEEMKGIQVTALHRKDQAFVFTKSRGDRLRIGGTERSLICWRGVADLSEVNRQITYLLTKFARPNFKFLNKTSKVT